MADYDYRNCQSLFGYAAKVHERSGGVCQLCGAGATELDFDLWRQMTVEHLIGESQGGYRHQISTGLAHRFPDLSPDEIAELAARIDAANTVTACSFCNATTSRAQAPTSMTSLIETAPDGTPEQIHCHVTAGLNDILTAKRQDVTWKLLSVRKAFESRVAPALADARLAAAPESPVAVTSSDVRMIAERITSDVLAGLGKFVTPAGYGHLSLALVDAVYSIRLRYSAVKRVVAAYCEASGTASQSLAARSETDFLEHGLDYLLSQAGTNHGEALADRLFGGSRSRTAGRLKADVCVEAARRLQAASVTCISDLHEHADNAEVRHAWTGVHGLGWVTWQYFCSLAGIDHFKPDVMLLRFAAETLGRYVSPAEVDALLSHAFEELKPSYPGLTKRALDHTIWLFQRGQ
ncbi:MAG TPA: hypothetical protein VFV73_10415 [Streptosporangiaceae bacterium]|nr:hypothetical protein [Streptosporangiaceae bacterium]